VFAEYYGLHYQQKKLKKEDSNATLGAQFRCISFHLSRYGGRAKLTPAVKNKWFDRWTNDWFYCQVPLHKSEASGDGIHLLRSKMSSLDYLTEAPHNCVTDDVNVEAFELATRIIGGCDDPLSWRLGLSGVAMSSRQITA
jgi:hypothetical protein